MFHHEIEVRFRDCDPMGHVNNAVYFTYLEAARFAWWRHLLGANALKDHGFIVARAACDYRAPALPGDRLLVELRVAKVGRSSFTIAYELLNARTRALVAEAETVQVVLDYASGRPMLIPDDLRAKLE
jgi:acyl-CoA thioester hydrolase